MNREQHERLDDAWDDLEKHAALVRCVRQELIQVDDDAPITTDRLQALMALLSSTDRLIAELGGAMEGAELGPWAAPSAFKAA